MIMEAKQFMKIGFSFGLLAIGLTVSAQNLEIPQKEFTISCSKDQLELSRGETRQLDITVLKSRGYQKSNTKMGISSSLPKGVAITFDPDKGNFDSTTASILIEEDAAPGEYSIILNATLNYTTKGTILNLLIK
jgi:hypothetical protein